MCYKATKLRIFTDAFDSRYPNGAAFDFANENATDPSQWLNPSDVEFVYTSCDAINCWIEPRCTVASVDGSVVRLKQDGNESCYHRLYYYAQVCGCCIRLSSPVTDPPHAVCSALLCSVYFVCKISCVRRLLMFYHLTIFFGWSSTRNAVAAQLAGNLSRQTQHMHMPH